MKAAVKWALHIQQPCTVWTDARNVADGIHALQDGCSLHDAAAADLWLDLASLLEQLGDNDLQVRHTPSHLDPGMTDNPYEDWLAEHNGHADTLAVLANSNRPQAVLTVHEAARSYHNRILDAQRALRSIFFGIADADQQDKAGHRRGAEADAEFQALPAGSCPRRVELEEVLPLNWKTVVGRRTPEFPDSFAVQVCEFLFLQDSVAVDAQVVSWLELVFMLHNAGLDPYPVCNAKGKWVDANTLAFPPPAHTVAVRLSLLRRVLRPALRDLGLDTLFAHGIDRSDLGVGFTLDGVVIGVSTSDALRARTSLGRFVQGRAAGSKAALARPL